MMVIKSKDAEWISKIFTVSRDPKVTVDMPVVYTQYDVDDLVKQASKWIRNYYRNKVNPDNVRTFLIETDDSSVMIEIKIRKPDLYIC